MCSFYHIISVLLYLRKMTLKDLVGSYWDTQIFVSETPTVWCLEILLCRQLTSLECEQLCLSFLLVLCLVVEFLLSVFLFQDDKDLVHEFVMAEGLTCLIKVGAEADQNYQNYILRGTTPHCTTLSTKGASQRIAIMLHLCLWESILYIAFKSLFFSVSFNTTQQVHHKNKC